MTETAPPNHYVNNKELYNHLIRRREIILRAKEENKPIPRVDPYLGLVIYNIANRLSYRWNFVNYTYRDEMVLDGIENCIKVIDNFDPEKSKNPFAYFTRIAFRAFVRRIKLEKTQQLIKNKMLENIPLDEFIDLQDQDDERGFVNTYLEFMRENNYNDTDQLDIEKRKKEIKKKEKLENFMEVDIQ